MKCKFCLAEIEEALETCPVCGKSLAEPEEMPEEAAAEQVTEEPVEEAIAEEQITEEPVEEAIAEEPIAKKKKSKVWKVVLAIAGVLVLAVALTGFILHSMGLSKTVMKKLGIGVENDIFRKDTYTVEASVLDKKDDVIVATMGDRTLTNRELQIYYWTTVDYYSAYLSYMGVDMSKPLDELIYDEKTGKTFQQIFLESAIEGWCQYTALSQLAEAEGFVLSEEQQKELDSLPQQLEEQAKEYGYTDLDELISKVYAPGGTVEAFSSFYKLNYLASCYCEKYYDDLKPTEEEIEAYYQAHETEFTAKKIGKDAGKYYDVRHILVAIEGEKDSSGEYTDAQWEACRAKAQQMLDDFLAGEATEEAFATLAVKNSADPGSASNGGLYEKLTENYGFIEDFENWYLEEGRKPGDTGLVKNTQSSVQGYHIMYYVGDTPIWHYETEQAIGTQSESKLIEKVEKVKEEFPILVDYSKIVLGKLEAAK